MFKWKRSLVLAASIAVAPFAAWADSQSTTFGVTVNVVNACTISGTTLDFGTYSPISATPTTGSSALTVTCTAGASGSIALDAGLQPASGSNALVPLRQMSSGTDRLAYFLYQDAQNDLPWGGSTAAESYTGTGSSSTLTVFGLITPQQVVPAATFTDTVTATINY